MNKQLLLLVFMLMPLAMRAYKVKIGDIYYELNQGKKQAEVTSAGSREWYNGNIVIPASVEYMGVTYSVTTIGNSAFSDCSNMISIVIPNSITSIGNSVFSGCFSMTSVNIPNSVKTIGDSAFSDCI